MSENCRLRCPIANQIDLVDFALSQEAARLANNEAPLDFINYIESCYGHLPKPATTTQTEFDLFTPEPIKPTQALKRFLKMQATIDSCVGNIKLAEGECLGPKLSHAAKYNEAKLAGQLVFSQLFGSDVRKSDKIRAELRDLKDADQANNLVCNSWSLKRHYKRTAALAIKLGADVKLFKQPVHPPVPVHLRKLRPIDH